MDSRRRQKTGSPRRHVPCLAKAPANVAAGKEHAIAMEPGLPFQYGGHGTHGRRKSGREIHCGDL